MKLFNKWVNTPIQKFFAILALFFLTTGVISIVGVIFLEHLVSPITLEVFKIICFMSLGFMCLSGMIVYTVELRSKLKYSLLFEDIKLMMSRGYTWCILGIVAFLILFYLDSSNIIIFGMTRNIGRILIITIGVLFLFGVIQNRKQKMDYHYGSIIRDIVLLSSIGIVFTFIGLYLWLHFPLL